GWRHPTSRRATGSSACAGSESRSRGRRREARAQESSRPVPSRLESQFSWATSITRRSGAPAVCEGGTTENQSRGQLRFRLHHGLILMNMLQKNVKPRKRGRPPGQSAQGAAARDRLYETAIRMISKRGYEATTLREIARDAHVSVGLLYRYFPSKQAVIVALYEELSRDFSRQAAAMKPGKWRDRFLFALETSLRVLRPHRLTLRALIPVLIGDPDDGVFAEGTAFSRVRVQQVFEDAVAGAADAPK